MSLWSGLCHWGSGYCDQLGVFHFPPQRGREHNARSTETASWLRRSLVHGAPGLPSDSTYLHVTRTAPTSRCSATAARDTAGAWTETDRRSLGLALDPAADQCVSKSHTRSLHKSDAFWGGSGGVSWFFCACPGFDHGGVQPPVGPTPRPDVHPLPPGTHLLFAQSGRIEHVPLEGYDMKKDDAKPVLHLPVSLS